MQETTSTVFRKWPNGDILALFPDDIDHWGHCDSYMHVGQHSGADYTGCIASTKPASPDEYCQLLKELNNIGYVCRIYRRRPCTR